MSHAERRIKERLHTTLDPKVMEVLRAHASPRGMGIWLEEAILNYAMSHGDRMALEKRERALHSKRAAIKAEMDTLTAELAKIEAALQEVQALKQSMEAIDPETFLKPIEDSMERWMPRLREWLGDYHSPVLDTRMELQEGPITVSYLKYDPSTDTYELAVERYMNSHMGLIRKIKDQARMHGILINDPLLHDYLLPRVQETVDGVLEQMTADSKAMAMRNMKRKLEKIATMKVEA